MRYTDLAEKKRGSVAMEDWRLIAFAVFMIAVVGVGVVLLQRRRKAQRTGNDPVYGVATLAPETVEQTQAKPRRRGVGTTSE